MASKQLGKLRQWAGEKISSRDKTVVVEDDIKELEQDIELRKQGILRLQAASEDYYHALSKKKESPSSGETGKLMPLDALGIVMVAHGEEYGDDSAFGSSLVALGRAHCKIATLQEAYGLMFRDTFLASCETFAQDIKDYEYQRKKLDSRRLSYDTAITKLEKVKNYKKEKEKEKREAEDELQRCRLRFEETSEDVHSRIQTIQENEILQLRELTNLLDVQLNFAKQYFEILNDVKANWCDESTLTKFEHMRVNSQSHTSLTDNDKYTTIHSKRSTPSSRTSSAESEDDAGVRTPGRRRSDTDRSVTPSRPASRASRKRSDSNTTTTVNEGGAKSNKRMNVTGWATNAVSSIAGLGKKDRDTFAALMNEAEEEKDGNPDLSRSPSSKSFLRKSPKVKPTDLPLDLLRNSGRILKPPSQQEKKVVKALYDFSGSSDELSFKAGDEITVIHEVLDDWWLGMHKDGRKGLFPTTYTEPVRKTHRLSPFEPDASHPGPKEQTDDRDSIHDYMIPPHSANSLGFDAQSVASVDPEEEEERHLMPVKPSEDEDVFSAPRQDAHTTPPILWSRTNSDTPRRPPPPPPPPRRSTITVPPLVPDRRLQMENDSSARVYTAAPNGTVNQDVSPFDSLVDMSSNCKGFEQHPHERKGLCKNCFRMH